MSEAAEYVCAIVLAVLLAVLVIYHTPARALTGQQCTTLEQRVRVFIRFRNEGAEIDTILRALRERDVNRPELHGEYYFIDMRLARAVYRMPEHYIEPRQGDYRVAPILAEWRATCEATPDPVDVLGALDRAVRALPDKGES